VIPYWLLFLYFAAGALLERDVDGPRSGSDPFLAIGTLIIGLMIGFRYHVGADWRAYADIFDYSGHLSARHMISIFGDPAYGLLTWSVHRAGGQIWMVNLVCGLIFAWGLRRFALAQANPWLAMVVAVPYLVVVVAMGYTRQAVAIGILMAGLASVLGGASTVRFAVYVAGAALFHKTAVVVLPLVAFAQERSRLVNLLAGLALSVLFYDLFLSESMNLLYRNYIMAEYSSQGAGIRVALSVVPSLLYLVNRPKFRFSSVESKLWFYFSIASLALAVLLVASRSSTAIDRLALYVIPIQLAVWSRAHVAYNLHSVGRLLVVALAGALLFTWLTFAVHAGYWVPYQVYPVWG
jgi:hypothetical protein